ncbi:MAG: mechanosensitive ion channel family protein, partial [Brevundimonas sp.]
MIDLSPALTAAAASSERVLTFDAALVARATQMAGDLAVNLGIAALIIIATWFGSKLAVRTVRRALGRVRGLKDDRTVEGFVVQVVRVAVVVIGLIAVLQRLGVQTTSIIAVLGAASLAVGLAMQGALSNVAAGVVLLVLRPYRVGEVVDIGGMAGVVNKLDLFTTQMTNANNVKIVVPNSQVLGGVIQNISGQVTRRIEIDFTVSYSADLSEAREVIRATAAAHGKVLEAPPVWTG